MHRQKKQISDAFLAQLKADETEFANLLFTKLETTKDGFLSPVKIRAGMKRIQETFKLSIEKKPIQRSDWKKLMNCIDYSNRDKISYVEFVNAATKKYKLIIGQNRLNQAFDIVDIDGTISINEIK